MNRRAFLKTGVGVSASAVLARIPGLVRSASAAGSDSAKWRAFEVITRAEIINSSGVSRAWLPMPLMPDTDYHKGLGHTWTGNTAATRIFRDEKYGAGIFYAEWPAGEAAPVVELVTRFATRDRAVSLSVPGNAAPEDKGVLAKYTKGTQFVRTDGIVLQKSREITKGLSTDLDKARAIYEWIVDNTFRDPKTRGCGLGDIRAMLETGYLGGKCADLNALYVGLARAAGIPARDIYGVRVADSAEYKSLGRSGDISKAQHCRAEFYTPGHGWVPVDPADVRKLVLEEGGGLPLDDPRVKKARVKLFGAWEMNWLAFNYAADVKLPNSAGEPIAFFMYPQAESAGERRDSLDPDGFHYKMTSRELAG
jgi:transglutaminase-like putative cysteine protease